ncbi:MAG: LacI family DNA-binding transcriptional regulator [Nocardioidaceae bacterium]
MTIHDVAAEAGVSITTVSRALNESGRVGPGTRERVLTVAQRLGYEPNDLARSLHGKATGTIAVLVPDITNPFFPELVNGVQEVANEHGRLLLLCQTSENTAIAVQELLHLRRKRVDGVVLVGVLAGGQELSTALAGMPVVTVDRDTTLDSAWVVRSNHRVGGRLATEHMIELGHERIAHISGPMDLSVAQDRHDGYREALEEAGLAYDESLVVEGDFLEQSGYDGLRALRRRRRRFTALFCGNDLMAIGALRALDEVGLAVPQEVSVVGFDDIHLASYLRPGLTTVHQPIQTLGRRAAELLIGPAMDGHDAASEVLDVHVVRRQTTAPLRRGGS